MKVLFVSSGNSKNFKIAPFIKLQGESLSLAGINVKYFSVKGKGIFGYFKNAIRLRKYLKNNPIDIVHAHYTLSGLIAVLSFSKRPIVLSLMGSDAYGDYIGKNRIKFSSRYLILLTYLIQPFVSSIICKSKHIQSYVYLKKKSYVVPNGILLDKIFVNENGFEEELGLNKDKRNVLFLGSKNDIRKNFCVIENALKLMDTNDINLVAPYPVAHDVVVKYLNTVDVIVVPSFMEGSPNIVKEAMACNCPVVATKVGDVEWLFGEEPGYYITDFMPENVAKNIEKALIFSVKYGRTNGRQRIIDLELDALDIANRIIEIYKKVFQY